MSVSEGLATLGFVSIFHIIGGIAVGVGLRRLYHGLSLQPLFFLVWGGFFGGMPLLIGASELAEKGMLIFFVAEIAILLGTILVAALIPDWIIDGFKSTSIYLMLFGGAFLIVGLLAGLSTLREQLLAGLILLFLFGGTGVAILAIGLRQLLK